jgi:hypothetical protein
MWTSGQEDELRSELQVEDGGLKDHDGEVWYLCSAPLGCVARDVELPEDVEGYTDGSSRKEKGEERIEEEERAGQGGGEDNAETSSGWWAREIVVETLSRDQGWSSGDPRCYGGSECTISLECPLSRVRDVRAVVFVVRAGATSGRQGGARYPYLDTEQHTR